MCECMNENFGNYKNNEIVKRRRYIPVADVLSSAIRNLDGRETETNRSAKIICDASSSSFLCDNDCDDLKMNMRRRMRSSRRRTTRNS